MSVKLLLLKSGDQIISDVKEIVRSEGESRVVEGYLFSKPHKISAIKPVVLTVVEPLESVTQLYLDKCEAVKIKEELND